jgi:hypothetical protein
MAALSPAGSHQEGDPVANLATDGDSPDLLMRDALIELATREEERIH